MRKPLALTAALLATLASAQAPPTPTLKVYSRETLVDVTVTDNKGQPVHGLKQSDFTVMEDGKPHPIRGFQEFGKSTESPRPLPALPPNVYTNLRPTTGPLNVLLFDAINGSGSEGRSQAAKFIESMPPGTQAAILGLGDKLTVLQGPTSNPELLLKVVHTPIKQLRVQAVACQRQIILDQAILDQLNLVASYLSGIKGRKNLIWIGSGIPPDMVFGGCQLWTQPLRNTYDRLAEAEVTVYPLDPRGVFTAPAPAFDGNITAASGAQASNQLVGFMKATGSSHLAMEAVAEATGGVAFYDNNDLMSLMAKAVDTGSSYYTLSYVPPSVGYDGRYHDIVVKVDKPNLRLLYRKGYSGEDPALIAHPPETLLGFKTRDTKPAGPVADVLAVAMSPIVPPATQLLFDVHIEPSPDPANPANITESSVGGPNARRKLADHTSYDLLYMLPQSQIAFADADGGTFGGSLEFNAAAFNAEGKLIAIRSQTLQLPLTAEEYHDFVQTPFKFFQQLDLPPGQLNVRVGVRDGVSNKLGTIDIPVTVPKPRPSPVAEGPPNPTH